jgi:1,4-alpha-glucan branching enzyme
MPIADTIGAGVAVMMSLDEQGGRCFRLEAPDARVVEVTVDFGGGVVRTLAMLHQGNLWMLRLPTGLPCVRYRFRVDGRTVSPDAEAGDDWLAVRPAA